MPHRLRAAAPGACLYGMRAHSTFGHGRAGCAPHAERLFCCKAEGVDALCSVVHPALPCPPVVASTAFPYSQAPEAAARSRRGMRRRIPWRTGAILRVWGGRWQRVAFGFHFFTWSPVYRYAELSFLSPNDTEIYISAEAYDFPCPKTRKRSWAGGMCGRRASEKS